jgi:hypothetical protein
MEWLITSVMNKTKLFYLGVGLLKAARMGISGVGGEGMG